MVIKSIVTLIALSISTLSCGITELKEALKLINTEINSPLVPYADPSRNLFSKILKTARLHQRIKEIKADYLHELEQEITKSAFPAIKLKLDTLEKQVDSKVNYSTGLISPLLEKVESDYKDDFFYLLELKLQSKENTEFEEAALIINFLWSHFPTSKYIYSLHVQLTERYCSRLVNTTS